MTASLLYLSVIGVIGLLLVIDLFVVHRAARSVSLKASAIWSALWVVAGLLFGVTAIAAYGGKPAVTSYMTAYLIEKSLSIDNVFLWLVVFAMMSTPEELRRRVLLYGILGAIVARGLLVHVGASLMASATWILYLAGGFLVITGVRLWRDRHTNGEVSGDGQPNRLATALHSRLPVTEDYRGARLFVREHGRWLATPLLVTLLLVESADVVLALDALPAALSVTHDTAVVAAANLFALVGLRSLFFFVEGVVERLVYLKAAVAVILVYIGASMLLEHATGVYHASAAQSLAVILVILAAGVVASLRHERSKPATVADRME